MSEVLEFTFSQEGDFEAVYAAEAFLKTAGFSYGSMQRGDPRAIVFGDHGALPKWRDIRSHEREELDGQMLAPTGSSRNGPIKIIISDRATDQAKAAFKAAIAKATQ